MLAGVCVGDTVDVLLRRVLLGWHIVLLVVLTAEELFSDVVMGLLLIVYTVIVVVYCPCRWLHRQIDNFEKEEDSSDSTNSDVCTKFEDSRGGERIHIYSQLVNWYQHTYMSQITSFRTSRSMYLPHMYPHSSPSLLTTTYHKR